MIERTNDHFQVVSLLRSECPVARSIFSGSTIDMR